MKYKLGEVVTYQLQRGEARYICTGSYPAGPNRSIGFSVLTPIPDGEDEMGLGRRYFAAEIVSEDLQMDTRLFETPDTKGETE